METIYVKESLAPEIHKKATALWEELAAESRKGRRWNVGYGQSRAGKLQFEFLRDIMVGWGVPAECIREEIVLPFPGYFLAERRWDMGVFNGDRLIAALEFKYYTLQQKYQQGRGSMLVNDLAFKALDLQFAAREAGVDRSKIFIGALLQVFRPGQPEIGRFLRKTRHPRMYAWAHTKQEAIRKAVSRLVLSKLYNAAVSMEAHCPNGRDLSWWSFPEQSLEQFLYQLRNAVYPCCRPAPAATPSTPS